VAIVAKNKWNMFDFTCNGKGERYEPIWLLVSWLFCNNSCGRHCIFSSKRQGIKPKLLINRKRYIFFSCTRS